MADLSFKAKVLMWSGLVFGAVTMGILGYSIARYISPTMFLAQIWFYIIIGKIGIIKIYSVAMYNFLLMIARFVYTVNQQCESCLH